MSQNNRNNLFAEQFHQCCTIACGSGSASSLRENEEYKKLYEEYKALYEILKQRMKDDVKPLLDYDDLKNTLAGMEDEAIYRQGFQDCVYLLRWMGLF